MLKFLSRVRIEFNALDARTASCMEFLAQCNARKAKESNPACQVVVKRRTDDHPPQITVTFVNGVEEVFDATSTSAQIIRNMILEKVSTWRPSKCSERPVRPGLSLSPRKSFANPHLVLNQGKQKRKSSSKILHSGLDKDEQAEVARADRTTLW